MTISFSQLLRGAKRERGYVELEITSDWMQGRSVFGGLQVVVALEAMRTLVPNTTLRTLQATFVAPVPEGAVTARAEVLRQGKSATHVEARLVHGSETSAIVIGVFGHARSSKARRVPRRPHVDADRALELAYVPGAFPSFTQHFGARWLRGSFPFSGRPTDEQVLEVAMKDEGPATEGHVIAIADFIAPVALSYLDAPAPGSTLTWMIEFLRDDLQQLPLTGWRVDAELIAARDGYTNQSVTVWAPDETAVALSRQSMLVFG
jgi:acyl-coenzyme A thioesterase PaaI-like protein